MSELLEEELRKSKLFKDESKLSIDYVPRLLPHREEQLKLLMRIFKVLIDNPGGMFQKALLIGSVGTGKTAVSKSFGNFLSSYAERMMIPLKYVHVNCHRDRNLFMVVKRIIQSVKPTLPTRGFSPQELIYMLWQALDERNAYVLVTLDEVDVMVKSFGESALYDILRISDEYLNKPQRMSLILISRDAVWLTMLDQSTRSSLMHNIIKFEPYTSHQLKDILNDRVKLAFYDGVVTDETLELIADLVGWDRGGSGDARYALELLWQAGKVAEAKGFQWVTPEHVREARASLHPSIRREEVQGLTNHEKYVLLSLARLLRRSHKAYASMGEMEEEYRSVCEEFQEQPRKHTQVWNFVQNLRNLGIVITKVVTTPKGRTTLISLPETPAELLEREVSKTL
ncbi:MAG: ORC1-type DNA replication protein [Candidatus Nezhaarchaeales archaeon]